MSRLSSIVPWIIALAALAAAFFFFVQRSTARQELAVWHAQVGPTIEDAKRKAAEIEAKALADAKATRELATKANERAQAAEALAQEQQATAARKLAEVEREFANVAALAEAERAKALHRIFPNLRVLEGNTITPTDNAGKPHAFVERVEIGKSITYYNTTPAKVQPVVSLRLYNAAGVRVASMFDSWSWNTIGPGERRIEDVGLSREFDIVGDPGEPVYYSIEIDNREPSER
jgi:hypothetical protein